MAGFDAVLEEQIAERELQIVVAEAAAAVQLAFDRALAHRAAPAAYPLPRRPDALERRIHRQVGKLSLETLGQVQEATATSTAASSTTFPHRRPANRRPMIGVRVPALVISPWVGRGSVGKERYDHTAIIKTILQRFRPTALGAPDLLPSRVVASPHLGGLLIEPVPRADTKCIATRSFTTGVSREHLRAGLDSTRAVRDAARDRREPTDLQKDLAAFRARAIAQGLPDPREDLRPARPRVPGRKRKA